MMGLELALAKPDPGMSRWDDPRRGWLASAHEPQVLGAPKTLSPSARRQCLNSSTAPSSHMAFRSCTPVRASAAVTKREGEGIPGAGRGRARLGNATVRKDFFQFRSRTGRAGATSRKPRPGAPRIPSLHGGPSMVYMKFLHGSCSSSAGSWFSGRPQLWPGPPTWVARSSLPPCLPVPRAALGSRTLHMKTGLLNLPHSRIGARSPRSRRGRPCRPNCA